MTLSTDPLFIDKVRDVVGLYLDPPEKALVLCMDEKSQIQALDRSQPVLPMMPSVPERPSHDYIRAGTATLFAALEVATGKVIGSLHRQHRAAEFKRFLTKVDKEVPAELQVHLVLEQAQGEPGQATRTAACPPRPGWAEVGKPGRTVQGPGRAGGGRGAQFRNGPDGRTA